jgi:hypothetical protein
MSEIQELAKRLEAEISKTPTGDLRNLLCDANIVIQHQEEKSGQLKNCISNLKSALDQVTKVLKTVIS